MKTFLQLLRDAREAFASGDPEAMLTVAIALLTFAKSFLYGGSVEIMSDDDRAEAEALLDGLEADLNSPAASAIPILLIGKILLMLLPLLREIIKKK